MPSLTIARGTSRGERFQLSNRETIIGRTSDCDIALPSRTVSRRHARIEHDADGYFLEDLHSVNGTGINGQKIERRTRLNNGDRIHVYDTVLVFSMADNSEESPAAIPVADVPAYSVDDSSFGWKSDGLSSSIEGSEAAAKTLKAILRLSQRVGATLDLDKTLTRVLDCLFEVFPNAERAYILQPDADANLVPTALKHRDTDSDTISPISNIVAQQVMREGVGFLTGNPWGDDRLDQLADSAIDYRIRSIICAPMMGPSATAAGVIHLESNDPRCPFRAPDLDVLMSAATLAGQAVEFAQLHRSLVELDARHREGVLAKDVQLKFLPQRPPSVPGYVFSSFYQAANYVAGDYFDYVELADGRWGIVLGDVAGKGVSAALFMARLGVHVRSALYTTKHPADAMARLNRDVLAESREDSFVTLVLTVLDPTRDELIVVNAGHIPPLLREAGSHDVRTPFPVSGSWPLGIIEDATYDEFVVPIKPGDSILMYTDGLTDARNPDGELYRSDGVVQAMSLAGSAPQHITRALQSDIRRFAAGTPATDDMCVVCLGREL